MPIYAYKCAECSHQLDVIRKVSDPPLTDCPNCGKPALVKQITAAGFHLKGAGWYVTDFRDAGSGKKKDAGKPDEQAKGDKAPDSGTEAKADAKADTKTDTKADTKTDTKTEAAADSKGPAKTDAKTEPKAEPKAEPSSKTTPPAPPTPKTGSSGTS
jgi:putative FmdB family regulatory protein